MSTKINGYMTNQPIGVFYEQLLKIKPAITKKARKLLLENIAEGACSVIDLARATGNVEGSKDQTVRDIIGKIMVDFADRKREVEQTKRRDPLVDVEMDLFLFPDGERTLFIVNSDSSDLTAMIAKMPNVQNYQYWDNLDKPDQVSSEDWEARRKDWEKMLPGTGRPADRCLVLSMTHSELYTLGAADNVMEHLPSQKSRQSWMGRILYLNENIGLNEDNLEKIVELTSNYMNDNDLKSRMMKKASKFVKPLKIDQKIFP